MWTELDKYDMGWCSSAEEYPPLLELRQLQAQSRLARMRFGSTDSLAVCACWSGLHSCVLSRSRVAATASWVMAA
jgi:hypothetical protein